MSFKQFTCKELFPDTPCCDDAENENFCFMRNDPRSKTWEVLRVEVHSCCKHSHQVKRLPDEFFIKHHRPYVVKETTSILKKKKKEEDDDWLW